MVPLCGCGPVPGCVLTHCAWTQNFGTAEDAAEGSADKDGSKLSYTQFKAWAESTPEVTRMLESVLGSEGQSLFETRHAAEGSP